MYSEKKFGARVDGDGTTGWFERFACGALESQPQPVLGVGNLGAHTQGSSCGATLGCVAEPLWGSFLILGK
jgi:hypothetical protein